MTVAIIAGASSGLGYEYAKLADQEQIDEIIIIARRSEKLAELASHLRHKVKIMVLDLTASVSFAEIKKYLETSGADVKYLFNCAGFGYLGKSFDMKDEQCERMVNLNSLAAVKLTNTVIPFMSEGARIINVSSCAGLLPLPYLSLYAATKSFLVSYSQSLNFELKSKNITVSAVCPSWIKDTDFILERSGNSRVQQPVLIFPTYKKNRSIKILQKSKKRESHHNSGFYFNTDPVCCRLAADMAYFENCRNLYLRVELQKKFPTARIISAVHIAADHIHGHSQKSRLSQI